MKNEDISVIILLYNTRENLIKNFKNYKDFKVLILDQSNDLEFGRKIKKFFPKLQYYLSSNENKGFAKGINFLIKKVKTKYFLCTQPDIFINKKSILELKKTLIKNKNCIISVPKILGYKNYENKKKKEKIHSVKNVIGAIFLSNKKKFVKFKMFDENFFFYWEDVDLCKRIEESKYKLFINHNSVAKHSWTSTKFNFKTFFIKSSNFKYGEYLYQYKNNKLKYIKIFREPINNFLLAFFYLSILKPKKFLERSFYIYGIVKFMVHKIFTNRF